MVSEPALLMLPETPWIGLYSGMFESTLTACARLVAARRMDAAARALADRIRGLTGRSPCWLSGEIDPWRVERVSANARSRHGQEAVIPPWASRPCGPRKRPF